MLRLLVVLSVETVTNIMLQITHASGVIPLVSHTIPRFRGICFTPFIVSCCQGSKCVNLKVIDGGPGCSVEDSAHKQIVDASYSTCKYFTGSTSCGWSDKILVTCKKTSYNLYDTSDYFPNVNAKVPLGPCSYNETYARISEVPLCGADLNLF